MDVLELKQHYFYFLEVSTTRPLRVNYMDSLGKYSAREQDTCLKSLNFCIAGALAIEYMASFAMD